MSTAFRGASPRGGSAHPLTAPRHPEPAGILIPRFTTLPKACAALPASGSITASQAGETIADLHVLGTITVTAPGVAIDDVCVIANGGGQLGSFGIQLEGGAANTLIEQSTIAGANRGRSPARLGDGASALSLNMIAEALNKRLALTGQLRASYRRRRRQVRAGRRKNDGRRHRFRDHPERWYDGGGRRRVSNPRATCENSRGSESAAQNRNPALTLTTPMPGAPERSGKRS
jgi:hypothetical protein